MKNSKLINIIIVSLFIAAIGLAIVIYQQNSQESLQKEESATPSSLSPEESISTSSGIQPPTLNLSKLSKEEIEVMSISSQSTEEERRKHFELAKSIAKTSEMLEIFNCLANPIVIKLKLGSNVTIRNLDSIEHAIRINKDLSYKIPAKGTKVVKVDFGRGHGLYGYGCDGIGPSGLMLVEQ